jgi:hypothetical protein
MKREEQSITKSSITTSPMIMVNIMELTWIARITNSIQHTRRMIHKCINYKTITTMDYKLVTRFKGLQRVSFMITLTLSPLNLLLLTKKSLMLWLSLWGLTLRFPSHENWKQENVKKHQAIQVKST